MDLTTNLEKVERYASRIWRTHSLEDPISTLSFNEYDYLKEIQMADEPIRLTDLADKMLVTKPSATRMVQRLERKNLVERKACLEDARSKRVQLTEHANKLLIKEVEVYQQMASELTAQLDSNEAELLNQLLNKALK